MLRVLGLMVLLAQPDDVPWHESYTLGVRLVEANRPAEGRAALERAVAARPEEGLLVRIDTVQYVDYLPHAYLALACQASGDAAAARGHLEAAERNGVAAVSATGRQLLTDVRQRLAADSGVRPPARFDSYPRRPTTLSDADFLRLRSEVSERCRLPAETTSAGAPWYFHYALGLELERVGDNQRALDALTEALHARPKPSPFARMYGLWFENYVPYYRIAVAHARLGNEDCAKDALAISRQLGEKPSPGDEPAEIRSLLQDLDRLPTDR